MQFIIKLPQNLRVFIFDFATKSNYICVFLSKFGKIKFLLKKYQFLQIVIKTSGIQQFLVLTVAKNCETELQQKQLFMVLKTYYKILQRTVSDITNKTQINFECCGTGYRVILVNSRCLLFFWGFSHPVRFYLPTNILARVIDDKNKLFLIEGLNQQLVGQVAAQILRLRKFNFYSGKGIKLLNQIIVLKEKKKATVKK